MTLPATRFATLSRRAALGITAALVMALLACLAASLMPLPEMREATSDTGDLAMYGHIVERLRAGESYYPVAHTELVDGGYGVQSVFNWRTPFFMSLLAALPGILWGQGLLMVIALAAGALAVAVIRRDSNWVMAGIAIPLLILSLGNSLAIGTVLFSELTAGALLLLSAMAYGARWRWLGLAAAVAALFVRELAAPFVLIALWFTWRDKRWPELIAWLGALAAYAAFFAWHYLMVQATVLPTDPSYPSGWLAFGGLQFLVRTAAFNGVFLLFPLWVSALILPLGMLGLLSWPGTVGRMAAITVAVYLVLLAIFGKPVNDYWGALYTPLLTLGLVWAPAALRDLLVRSRRSS